MEKALKDQSAHEGDKDGTPEKQAIMMRIDQEMTQGFEKLQRVCSSGNSSFGVHYGVTIYTYPTSTALAAAGRSTTVRAHPQASSLEDLQEVFKSDFFATA